VPRAYDRAHVGSRSEDIPRLAMRWRGQDRVSSSPAWMNCACTCRRGPQHEGEGTAGNCSARTGSRGSRASRGTGFDADGAAISGDSREEEFFVEIVLMSLMSLMRIGQECRWDKGARRFLMSFDFFHAPPWSLRAALRVVDETGGDVANSRNFWRCAGKTQWDQEVVGWSCTLRENIEKFYARAAVSRSRHRSAAGGRSRGCPRREAAAPRARRSGRRSA
jgi:hypothetical protein